MVSGYDDGSFRLEAGMSREHRATMLDRHAEYKTMIGNVDRFTDGGEVSTGTQEAVICESARKCCQGWEMAFQSIGNDQTRPGRQNSYEIAQGPGKMKTERG